MLIDRAFLCRPDASKVGKADKLGSTPNSRDGTRACGGDTNVKTMATEEMAHITSSRGSTKCYNEVVIESQQFNKLRGWIERPVKGQPTITLQARIVPSDYAHFGYRFTKPARS